MKLLQQVEAFDYPKWRRVSIYEPAVVIVEIGEKGTKEDEAPIVRKAYKFELSNLRNAILLAIKVVEWYKIHFYDNDEGWRGIDTCIEKEGFAEWGIIEGGYIVDSESLFCESDALCVCGLYRFPKGSIIWTREKFRDREDKRIIVFWNEERYLWTSKA